MNPRSSVALDSVDKWLHMYHKNVSETDQKPLDKQIEMEVMMNNLYNNDNNNIRTVPVVGSIDNNLEATEAEKVRSHVVGSTTCICSNMNSEATAMTTSNMALGEGLNTANASTLMNSASDGAGTVSIKAGKKRPRASRRAPTTVFNTDASNFKAMVQHFTGVPTPSFVSTGTGAHDGGHQLLPMKPMAQRALMGQNFSATLNTNSTFNSPLQTNSSLPTFPFQYAYDDHIPPFYSSNVFNNMKPSDISLSQLGHGVENINPSLMEEVIKLVDQPNPQFSTAHNIPRPFQRSRPAHLL
eukprot:Gb_37990 [translate_table: standard]